MIKNKLIWSFICLALIGCGNASYEPQEYISTNLTEEKINLSKEVFNKLKKEHFIKNFVKDDFNIKYIDALINKLDENKLYFIASEIKKFQNESKEYSKQYFDIDLAYLIINLYFERLAAFSEYQIKLIEKNSFDFTKQDFIDIYYEDNQWPESEYLLKNIWRNETKNELLVALMSETHSDDQENVLLKRYKNKIRRIQQQKEDDIFSITINTLTNQFDPHSAYLSPRSAEDFDMNMSLKLEGIGALLGADDDYTKIVSLVPGGPAEKSGEILPEDKITRIRQINAEDKEYVDVVGWRIDEVVDLIRGKSGTQLEIEFISSDSADNTRKLVTLTREEIKLEDRMISVSGSKGKSDFTLPESVSVSHADDVITITYDESSSESTALAGTARSLINNMVIGVSQGFQKTLLLVGVGYRAKASGKKLELTLGFSHPVHYDLPEQVEVETPSQTEVVLKSHDKQVLGQVAAEIRAFRPPEPYKGKGVKYADENIRRKEAKKAAGA